MYGLNEIEDDLEREERLIKRLFWWMTFIPSVLLYLWSMGFNFESLFMAPLILPIVFLFLLFPAAGIVLFLMILYLTGEFFVNIRRDFREMANP